MQRRSAGRRSCSLFAIPRLFPCWLLASLCFLGGCAAFHSDSSSISPPRESPPAPAVALPRDSHGYALLFDLVSDEKDISKLHFLKRERPEMKLLLQEIARASRQVRDQLARFGKADARFNLTDQGLPPAEVETRKAIGKFKEHALLSSKDKDLEIQLLLSQNEALTYGAHLAASIARVETDPSRQEFLRHTAATLGGLQQKVLALLLKNYAWPETK